MESSPEKERSSPTAMDEVVCRFLANFLALPVVDQGILPPASQLLFSSIEARLNSLGSDALLSRNVGYQL